MRTVVQYIPVCKRSSQQPVIAPSGLDINDGRQIFVQYRASNPFLFNDVFVEAA